MVNRTVRNAKKGAAADSIEDSVPQAKNPCNGCKPGKAPEGRCRHCHWKGSPSAVKLHVAASHKEKSAKHQCRICCFSSARKWAVENHVEKQHKEQAHVQQPTINRRRAISTPASAPVTRRGRVQQAAVPNRRRGASTVVVQPPAAQRRRIQNGLPVPPLAPAKSRNVQAQQPAINTRRRATSTAAAAAPTQRGRVKNGQSVPPVSPANPRNQNVTQAKNPCVGCKPGKATEGQCRHCHWKGCPSAVKNHVAASHKRPRAEHMCKTCCFSSKRKCAVVKHVEMQHNGKAQVQQPATNNARRRAVSTAAPKAQHRRARNTAQSQPPLPAPAPSNANNAQQPPVANSELKALEKKAKTMQEFTNFHRGSYKASKALIDELVALVEEKLRGGPDEIIDEGIMQIIIKICKEQHRSKNILTSLCHGVCEMIASKQSTVVQRACEALIIMIDQPDAKPEIIRWTSFRRLSNMMEESHRVGNQSLVGVGCRLLILLLENADKKVISDFVPSGLIRNLLKILREGDNQSQVAASAVLDLFKQRSTKHQFLALNDCLLFKEPLLESIIKGMDNPACAATMMGIVARLMEVLKEKFPQKLVPLKEKMRSSGLIAKLEASNLHNDDIMQAEARNLIQKYEDSENVEPM